MYSCLSYKSNILYLVAVVWSLSLSSHSTDDGSSCANSAVDFGAFSYFLVSTIILGVCIVLYMVLMNLEYIRYACDCVVLSVECEMMNTCI